MATSTTNDPLVSFFKTPDDLATLVLAAVGKWEFDESQRQQQRYAESRDLEEILLDAAHIQSLNSSLKIAQEMQNESSKALTEEQIFHFRHIKGESWKVAQLNDKIKELDRKAQALIMDIRSQLVRESQDAAKALTQNGAEKIDRGSLESQERVSTIVNKFERELEHGKQIAKWIQNQRHDLVNDGLQALQMKLNNRPALLQQIESPQQTSTLKRELEQYLRRISVAVSLGRTNLLDSAKGLDESPREVYKLFFEYIEARKVRTSSGLLQSQKLLLAFYIEHLITHVFIDL